jgi:hypothetical protein
VRGKKRPTTERAAAVGLATVVGISEAARQTGIPRRTVNDWFESPEFAELRQRTKDQVADEWWAGVQHGVKAVIREFDGDAPLRDKAIAVGVLFDKLALMRGEATARTESKTFSDDLNDHERAALRQAIDTALNDSTVTAAADSGDAAVEGSSQS